MEERAVVTCFLRNQCEVLLLRRSDEVGSYSGRWGAVAGHAEGDPDVAARAEIREETGLSEDVALVRGGDPFPVVDDDLGIRWTVHPYLFDCASRDVVTNRETDETAWVQPPEILRRETVPRLWTSYDRVRPRVATVREDREHGSAYLSLRALEVLRDEAALATEGRHDELEAPERDGDDWSALAGLARDLLSARPSMAVVTNRVNRAMSAASDDGDEAGTATGPATTAPAAVERAARETIERAVTADGDAAALAAQRLPDRVATLSRSATVRDALVAADPESILVAESRPGHEGVGVAEELASSADVTLTTDAALAFELVERDRDALVVGADRIRPDGSVVNKVGTRGAAFAATAEEIDCYVVAASEKIVAGDEIAASARGADEETTASDEVESGNERDVTDAELEPRDPGEVYDGDADVTVANPTFDVTPAHAVDAVLTERGALDADEVRGVAREHARLAAWM